jgi:hypothetical protein
MCFASPKVKENHDFLKEILKYHGKTEILDAFVEWKPPVFQIRACNLTELGVAQGPQTGFVLNKLKQIWVDREFRLQLEEVGEYLPQILKDWELVAGDYVKPVSRKRKKSH